MKAEYLSGYKSCNTEVKAMGTYNVSDAIRSFRADPPDTDFQRGYLLRLIEFRDGYFEPRYCAA